MNAVKRPLRSQSKALQNTKPRETKLKHAPLAAHKSQETKKQQQEVSLNTDGIVLLLFSACSRLDDTSQIIKFLMTTQATAQAWYGVVTKLKSGVWGKWATAAPWETQRSDEETAQHLYTAVVGQSTFYDSLFAFQCLWAIILYYLAVSRASATALLAIIESATGREYNLNGVEQLTELRQNVKQLQDMADVAPSNAADPKAWVAAENVKRAAKAAREKLNLILRKRKGFFRLINLPILICAAAYVLLVSAHQQQNSVDLYWGKTAPAIAKVLQFSSRKSKTSLEAFMYGRTWELFSRESFALSFEYIGENKIRQPWLRILLNAVVRAYAFLLDLSYDYVNIKGACYKVHNIQRAAHTVNFCNRHVVVSTEDKSNIKFCSKMCETSQSTENPALDTVEGHWTRVLTDVQPCKNSCSMLNANWAYTLMCNVFQFGEAISVGVFGSCNRRNRQHFPYNARASQPSKCLEDNKTVCDTDECRNCQFYETLERKKDLAGKWTILPDVVAALTGWFFDWVFLKVLPPTWRPEWTKNDSDFDITTVSCLMMNLFAFSLITPFLLKTVWFLIISALEVAPFLAPIMAFSPLLALFLAPSLFILFIAFKPIVKLLNNFMVKGDVTMKDREEFAKELEHLAHMAYQKTKREYQAYEKQVYASTGIMQDAFVVYREVALGLAQLGTFWDVETMTAAFKSFHTRSGSLARTFLGMLFYLALFVYLLEFVGTQNVRCHIARVLHFVATGTDRVTPFESGAYFRALKQTPSFQEYKDYRETKTGQDKNEMKIENLPYALAQAQQSLDQSNLWQSLKNIVTTKEQKIKREYSDYIANQVLPLRLPYGERGICKISPPFNPQSYVQQFGFYVKYTFCAIAGYFIQIKGCKKNACEGYFDQVQKDYTEYEDYTLRAVKDEDFTGLCHDSSEIWLQDSKKLTQLKQDIQQKTENLAKFAFEDAEACEAHNNETACVQNGAGQCQWASDQSCAYAKTEVECEKAVFCHYRDGECKPLCAAYKTSGPCNEDRRCTWYNDEAGDLYSSCDTRPLCTAKHEQDRDAMREKAKELRVLVDTYNASKARKQMCGETSTTHTLCQEDKGNLFQPCSNFDTTTIQGVKECMLRERVPLPGMDLCFMDSSYGRSTARSTFEEAQIRKLSPNQRANPENATTLRANMCSIRTNCKANVSREECADLTVGYGIDGVVACQEKLDFATGEMTCTNKSTLAKHDVCTALYLGADSSNKTNDPVGFCQNEVPSMFPSKIECRMGLTLGERAQLEASGQTFDEWSPETTCHRVAINVGDEPRTTTNSAFFENAKKCYLGSDTETCQLVKNSKGLVATKAPVRQMAARFAKKAEQIALEEASTDAPKSGDYAGLQGLVFVHAFLRDAIPLVRAQTPATEIGQAGGLQNALGYYPRVFQKLVTGLEDLNFASLNDNCVVTRTFFGELPALPNPNTRTHKRHHVYTYSRDECDSVLCSLKCGEKYEKTKKLPRLQNDFYGYNFPFSHAGAYAGATSGDKNSGCRALPNTTDPLLYGEDVEAELKVRAVEVKEGSKSQNFFYYDYANAAPSPWQANVTRLVESCVGAYIDVFYEHIEEGTFAKRSMLWNHVKTAKRSVSFVRNAISVTIQPQLGCGHGRFVANSNSLQSFSIPQIAFDSKNTNEVASPKNRKGERLDRRIWAAWAASCFVNSSTEHRQFLDDTLKAHRSILHCSHLWAVRDNFLERAQTVFGPRKPVLSHLEGGLAGNKDGNYVWPLHPIENYESVTAEDDEWHWREMYLALRFGYIMAQLAVLRPGAENMPGAQNSITWSDAWRLFSVKQKQKMQTYPWDDAYRNGKRWWLLDAQ